MSDLLANLALGFGVAAQPYNILFCLLGALVGTLVGVLPGIGTVATIAMLLPITFGLPPVGALIMLAGIYYGAQYGGSTTSILVNIPGEATSVVTALDGHQMARQGRAGAALSIAAIGSFFAGCVATVLVAALGAPLTGLALLFGPAEYFSLMVLGLIFAVVLAKGSVLKAVAVIVLGLLLSMVGSDLETGAGRMTFDLAELADGIGFANIAMGVFGFAEIIRNLELPEESRDVLHAKVSGLMPTRKDLIDSSGAIARGTIVGSLLGILPGGGERQQRGGADLVHPAAHPRHPAQRGDGADGRRHDHPRHRAGPAGHDQAAGAVLGHDRVDVAGQPDACRHQPAAGRRVGHAAARSLPAALSLDHRVLLHRRLFDQQLSVRRHHRSDIRRDRVLAAQARLRAGAHAARLRAGAADGGKSPPRHADRARRLDGVFHPPDLGGLAGHRHLPADHRRDAQDPAAPRRSLRRVGRVRLQRGCDKLPPRGGRRGLRAVVAFACIVLSMMALAQEKHK